MSNVRRALALALLSLGLAGGALVGFMPSTVIGSSGDAGVLTTCGAHAKTCTPSGPNR